MVNANVLIQANIMTDFVLYRKTTVINLDFRRSSKLWIEDLRIQDQQYREDQEKKSNNSKTTTAWNLRLIKFL